MIEVIRSHVELTSWADLKKAAQERRLDRVLQSGDIIPFKFTSVEDTANAVIATQDRTGKWFFVLQNCMDTQYTPVDAVDNWDTLVPWRDNKIRTFLNKDVIEWLPEEMRAVIEPTKIVQYIDGKRIETEDKLFLLSRTQVFGHDIGRRDMSEPEDNPLEIFSCVNRAANRIKLRNNIANAWWLRSVREKRRWGKGTYVSTKPSAASCGMLWETGVVFAFCIE